MRQEVKKKNLYAYQIKLEEIFVLFICSVSSSHI